VRQLQPLRWPPTTLVPNSTPDRIGATVARDGPDHWGELDNDFSACQTGHHQSPIDIRNPKSADLPPIQFAYQGTPLHIVNNGHTIQVNYAPGSFITVGGQQYQLTQFHFHHPSEERINSKRFAMVAHLVHTSPEGGPVVVAVLLDAGAANPTIASLWQHLPTHEGPEQQFDDVQIDATGLLPQDRAYYTFTGSLTTPPCTDGVTWFVLKTPEPISRVRPTRLAGSIRATHGRSNHSMGARCWPRSSRALTC